MNFAFSLKFTILIMAISMKIYIEGEFVKIQEFVWDFTSKNDNLGVKMKILKFFGIQAKVKRSLKAIKGHPTGINLICRTVIVGFLFNF